MIVEIMLRYAARDRASIHMLIERNGIFCVRCGRGERDAPNPRCSCRPRQLI